jgi:hypothetical protein
VLDPLFFGQNMPDAAPDSSKSGVRAFAQLLAAVGQRPLGLEASQVTAVVRWLGQDLDHGSPSPPFGRETQSRPPPPVQIVTTGPRSETVAMVAASLEPALFSALESRHSISTLMDIFDHASAYSEAPELTCLDLYHDFDFNTLTAIASPVRVNLSATVPARIFWD